MASSVWIATCTGFAATLPDLRNIAQIHAMTGKDRGPRAISRWTPERKWRRLSTISFANNPQKTHARDKVMNLNDLVEQSDVVGSDPGYSVFVRSLLDV